MITTGMEAQKLYGKVAALVDKVPLASTEK